MWCRVAWYDEAVGGEALLADLSRAIPPCEIVPVSERPRKGALLVAHTHTRRRVSTKGGYG